MDSFWKKVSFCKSLFPAIRWSVGTPVFAEGQELLRFGHALFGVSDGPAFSYAEVVDGEDVRAAEAEDQEHFDGPGADAADGDEAFDEFFVGQFLRLIKSRNNSFDRFLGEVLHGEDLCTGEAGLAEDGPAKFQHLFGRRGATVAA